MSDAHLRRRLRIGLLHAAPRLGDLDGNRELIEHGTRIAAAAGADWVLSGELVVTGYRFSDLIGTDWIVPEPAAWLRRLQLLSAELGTAMFVSHPDRDAHTNRLYNTMFAIDRAGRIVGRHRKLRPTPGAEDWSSPNDDLSAFDVDGSRVGMLVCADAYSPEPARRLRADGAQLIMSAATWWPGDWGPSGEWEARSQDAGLPIVVANRTGIEGSTDMRAAESVVVDRGKRLLTMAAVSSTLFLIEIAFEDGHIRSATFDASPLAT